MPSVGGSHWEALSLMHAAKRQAQIFLSFYTAHTLDQFKELGFGPLRSTKLARKLHAHSVQHAQILTCPRCAIENKNTHHNSVAPEPCAARNPPDPH
eukprot:745705-Pelagomonas_calceolata.AAC.1